MCPDRRAVLLILCLLALLLPSQSSYADFSFIITSDQRNYTGDGPYDTSSYFRGVLEAAAKTGKGQFMISPGDIDEPQNSFFTIEQILGTSYQWFPVTGNHELPGRGTEAYPGANMEWLRSFDYDINGSGTLPDIVNIGPAGCRETTFSYDYENTHFIVLNEYCNSEGDDVTDGDIPDHLYSWLAADLAATEMDHILVFGHEPAYPQPDNDNGRLRHSSDSLNANPAHRDRFWDLLKAWGVSAYFCGHTHNFSIVKLDGLWQIDSGHARGMGDTGAPSTYIRMDIGTHIRYTVFRDTHNGVYDYSDIIHRGTIAGRTADETVSFQDGVAPTRNYSGTRDTTLSQTWPETNFGKETLLMVDGDDPAGTSRDISTLLRWDMEAILPHSRVLEAEITLQITESTDDAYFIYGLRKNWNEQSATWNMAASSTPWQQPGATGIEDRGSSLLAASSPGRKGEMVLKLNPMGLALIQSWVSHPANNHGLVISNGTATNGFDFASSEYVVPEQRPKLTVRFTVQPPVQSRPLPWLHLLLGH